MAKTKLREYKRLSTPVFTMPNALQDVIPIREFYIKKHLQNLLGLL